MSVGKIHKTQHYTIELEQSSKSTKTEHTWKPSRTRTRTKLGYIWNFKHRIEKVWSCIWGSRVMTWISIQQFAPSRIITMICWVTICIKCFDCVTGFVSKLLKSLIGLHVVAQVLRVSLCFVFSLKWKWWVEGGN